MQTPEEMLDIFLEETGKQREDILSYARMKEVDFISMFNKPVCLKRYALFVSYTDGFLIKERVHVSDRYDLVIDEGDK